MWAFYLLHCLIICLRAAVRCQQWCSFPFWYTGSFFLCIFGKICLNLVLVNVLYWSVDENLHPMQQSPFPLILFFSTFPLLHATAPPVTSASTPWSHTSTCVNTHTVWWHTLMNGVWEWKHCAASLLRCSRLILYWSATSSLGICNACLRRRA